MTGTPRLTVVPDDGTPPWRQVRDQLVTLVETGELATGARLPPIRQLAGDLGLAPGTVARAYKELEADGIVRSAGRHGTVVTARARTDGDPLRDAAEQYVRAARALGADRRTATSLVDRLYDAVE